MGPTGFEQMHRQRSLRTDHWLHFTQIILVFKHRQNSTHVMLLMQSKWTNSSQESWHPCIITVHSLQISTARRRTKMIYYSSSNTNFHEVVAQTKHATTPMKISTHVMLLNITRTMWHPCTHLYTELYLDIKFISQSRRGKRISTYVLVRIHLLKQSF